MNWGALQIAVGQRLRSRRFWHGGGLLMLAHIIVTALGLVRVPVVTRILSKDEVGMIGVVASALPFLQLLSLSGLDGATYHYVAKGYPTALRVNIAIRLRWSILSTLGFLVGGMYWLWAGNSILAGLFSIAALTYPFTTGLTAVAGFLGAREDFGHLFWYRIGEALTRYVGFGVLLLLPVLSSQVLWFSLANNLALAVLQIGVAGWLINQLRREGIPRMLPQERREMVHYGKHLTVLNSITTAQTQVDGLLVGWFLPLSVMADYSIAQIVYTLIQQLWKIYNTVRYPPFVRLPLVRRQRRMVLEMWVVWAGFIVLGLATGAGLWVLVPVILPPEYGSSLPFVSWLLATFVVGVPGLFAQMYFQTRQDERSLYLLRGTAAVGGIVVPSFLIFFWRAYGVVVGRFVAGLALSVAGIYLFVQDIRREHETVLNTQSGPEDI